MAVTLAWVHPHRDALAISAWVLHQNCCQPRSLNFCEGYGGHTFTAIVDEFGSLFDSNVEQQCFHDIVMYMDKTGGAAGYNHQAVQSWFYW